MTFTHDDRRSAILESRFDAHEGLFAHRHEDATPAFHEELIADLWGEDNGILIGFRGAAKSTRAEEFVTLAACERKFKNCLFIGPSEARAAERLEAVKAELEGNEFLVELYGEQRSEPWTQTKCVLRGGHAIQAIGVGQKLRGIKHRDWRPDLVIVDDFEDEENTLTPEARRKALRWFLGTLRLACDPRCRIIVLSTLISPDCVPLQLVKAGWKQKRYPVSYIDESGEEVSIWPERFPMSWIEQRREEARKLGEADLWALEMECNDQVETHRAFTSEMIRIEPVERTWQPVYAMIDPARTVRRTSATTGWAVWSWVKNRLIVWDAGAKRMLPDEIVQLVFEIAQKWQPVEIGVEKDGLDEWLLQPIRAEQLRRHATVPVRGVKAPRGKIDFIKGLHWYFANGEAVFCRDLSELREQLLGFPTGRIDAPNALAYALQLKPGRLIYEGWNPNFHIEPLHPSWQKPLYLAANTDGRMVTAALVQLDGGRILILADWIAEGEPAEALEGIVREASMTAGRRITLVAPEEHYARYTNFGLVQAARSLGLETRTGSSRARARAYIIRELGRMIEGRAALAVSPDATWTLGAFAGGYSRPLVGANLGEEAAPGRYRLLMEGIEALIGLFAIGLDEDEEADQNWAYDASGRRYRSALPERMQLRH